MICFKVNISDQKPQIEMIILLKCYIYFNIVIVLSFVFIYFRSCVKFPVIILFPEIYVKCFFFPLILLWWLLFFYTSTEPTIVQNYVFCLSVFVPCSNLSFSLKFLHNVVDRNTGVNLNWLFFLWFQICPLITCN